MTGSSRRIFLDANATTPCAPEVVEAMAPWWSSANPSSPHEEGQRARRAVEEAREEVARLLGAAPSRLVFTSGGTEADNLAVAGLARAVRRGDPARRTILVSAVEHPAVAESARGLEAEGFSPVVVPVDADGVVDLERLAELAGDETALVAVMAASNETGTIEPWREAAEIARRAGARFFVDAVQAIGRIPFDFDASVADAAAVSAHKFHGPKGVGALVLREGAEPEPILRGGLQQRRRRPGTEPVPLIVGFAAAARLARERGTADAEAIARRRDRLEGALLAALPGAFVNGKGALRLPNTISLTIPGLSAETLLIRLDLDEGIALSTGAACSTGVVRPSATLLALGLSPRNAASTLRISLSREITDEEVSRAAEAIPRAARGVRGAGATP